jgi:hypothetical protein
MNVTASLMVSQNLSRTMTTGRRRRQKAEAGRCSALAKLDVDVIMPMLNSFVNRASVVDIL